MPHSPCRSPAQAADTGAVVQEVRGNLVEN